MYNANDLSDYYHFLTRSRMIKNESMILHKNKLDIFILFSEINNEFLFLLKGDPLAKIKPKAIIRKKVQNKLHAYRVKIIT